MPGNEPALKRMCQQISSVYMSIMTKEESIQATKLPKEQWSNFHKANPVTFNDVILADLLTPLQVEAGKIERRLQYDRTVTDRNKRILSECANIPRRPHVCDRCGVPTRRDESPHCRPGRHVVCQWTISVFDASLNEQIRYSPSCRLPEVSTKNLHQTAVSHNDQPQPPPRPQSLPLASWHLVCS
jgi:hypothetical protein